MSLLAMFMLLFMVGLGVYTTSRPVEKESLVINTQGGVQTTLTSGPCAVNSKLVSPCRPLIGNISSRYPGVSGWESNIYAFEKRAGRWTDVAHNYHKPEQPSLTPGEIKIANRGTLLYLNWKPDTYWGNVNGKNASVNARIDRMARSIKSLGSKKVFLAVYHEPENDISKGGSKCSRSVGNKGTTAEYRAMWRTVRQRFDALGVKNVVWVMNYMGWSGWDCAVKDLWPGNNLVDWVTWDPYTNDKGTFMGDMLRFSNFLSENTDEAHNFTSKPWGISEMGYEGHDQKKAYKYYDDMASAIVNNRLPHVHMYLFFDENGADFGGDPKWDSRIGYARSGRPDSTEQRHFNEMFKKVTSLSKPRDITDTQPPKATLNTPSPAKAVSGTVSFNVTASDNDRVKAVSAIVDGKWLTTDFSTPFDFNVDTRKLKNGQHTIFFRAWDYSENRAETRKITFTVRN